MKKHIVTCVKCGRQFDANEGGAYYPESRRYVCKRCVDNYTKMLSVRVRWCLFVREIKHSGVFGLNYCVCSCWFVSVDKKDFVDKLLLKNWWGIFISKSPHWGNFGGILPPNPPLFYRVHSPRRFTG